MRNNNNAFSLMEMLVVMAIISVLCTLFFSAIMKSISKGKQSQCINNLKQIGQAVFMYASDWQGNLPQAKRFTSTADSNSIAHSLSTYIDNSNVYICPSADKRFKEWFRISYIYNTEGYQSDPVERIGGPVKNIASSDKANPSEIWTLICARPTGEPHAHFEYFSDVLWLDGHVGAFKQEIE